MNIWRRCNRGVRSQNPSHPSGPAALLSYTPRGQWISGGARYAIRGARNARNLWRPCLIALLLIPTIRVARADPAANEAMHLFLQVCQVNNLANPERIRVWAAEHHLPEITDPAGRAIYVGNGSSDNAWWVHIKDTELVVALRSATSGCAIYVGTLDPSALGQLYDMLVDGFAKKGAVMTPLPDRAEVGSYGTRIGKVRLLEDPSAKFHLLFTLITNARLGGPYQGALQVSLMPQSLQSPNATPRPE